jgi:hypothetical protein
MTTAHAHAHFPDRHRALLNQRGRFTPGAKPENYPLYATCRSCGEQIVNMGGGAEWATLVEMQRHYQFNPQYGLTLVWPVPAARRFIVEWHYTYTQTPFIVKASDVKEARRTFNKWAHHLGYGVTITRITVHPDDRKSSTIGKKKAS